MRRLAATAALVALATLDPPVGCGRQTALHAAGHARPTVTIDLRNGGVLSSAAVEAARREVEVLWRAAGIDVRPAAAAPATALRVVLMDEPPGQAAERSGLPLGSLRFEEGRPDREILVFYQAVSFVAAHAGTPFWPESRSTPGYQDRIVGRVLGRVIAHEVGHYLLASMQHTATGLMRATHSAAEFAAPSRAPFWPGEAERLAPPAAQ